MTITRFSKSTDFVRDDGNLKAMVDAVGPRKWVLEILVRETPTLMTRLGDCRYFRNRKDAERVAECELNMTYPRL